MSSLALYLLFALSVSVLARRAGWLSQRTTIVALICLPLVATGGAHLSGAVMAPTDRLFLNEPLASEQEARGVKIESPSLFYDVAMQIVPWRAAVRAAYRSGGWPLWNPYILCGDPLAGSAQPAPYHPVHLVSSLLPLEQATTFTLSATLFLAGLTMFALVRALGVAPGCALVAGAAWQFGALSTVWLMWPIGLALATMPLVVLGAHRSAREPGLASAATLSLGLVLSILAGSPETTLFVAALAAIWWLGEAIGSSGVQRLRAAKWSAAATLAAVTLTGFFLFPFVANLPLTEEWELRAQEGAQAGSPAMTRVVESAVANLLPFSMGPDPVETRIRGADRARDRGNAWAGSLVLVAALAGLVLTRDARSRRLVFLAACGFAVAWQLPGVDSIRTALPLFGRSGASYGYVWAAFAVVLLAAKGFHELLDPGRRKLLLRWLAGGLIGFAIAIALWWGTAGQLGEGSATLSAPLVLVAPLALALFAAGRIRDRRALESLVLLLVVAERAIETRHYFPARSPSEFYPKPALVSELPESAAPYRVVGIGTMARPNASTLWGLEDVRGYNAMTLARYADTARFWAPERHRSVTAVTSVTPFLSLMNVRFAFVPPGAALPDDWRIRATRPGFSLAENLGVLPRAFFPRRVVLGGTREQRLSWLARAPAKELSELVWLNGDEETPLEIENPAGTVELLESGFRYRLKVALEKPSWLFLSVTSWPGWRATSDGSALETAIADHAFLAVRVPAGRRVVALDYRPEAFRIGLFATAASIALVLGALARRRRLGGALGLDSEAASSVRVGAGGASERSNGVGNPSETAGGR